VTPRVHGNVVLGHILALEEGRGGNGARTNDEERGLEGMLVEVVQEVGSVKRGTVVVRETPCVLRGARRDVRLANTSSTRPPTTTGIGGGLGVGCASSNYSLAQVWNLDTRRLDLGNPLLNLWGVGGRNSVKLGVIGGNNGCG